MTTLILKDDGTYLIGNEVVECVPDFSKESEYGISYAVGTWQVTGRLIQFTQKEAHQGNFMTTGNYGDIRFKVSSEAGVIYLTSQGMRPSLVLKFREQLPTEEDGPKRRPDETPVESPPSKPDQALVAPHP